MKDNLTKYEYRTLIVLYKLAGGEAGVDILETDIINEIESKKVYAMSDEEFTKYHKEILKEVKLKKN